MNNKVLLNILIYKCITIFSTRKTTFKLNNIITFINLRLIEELPKCHCS